MHISTVPICLESMDKSAVLQRQNTRALAQDMRLAWEEPFGPTIPVLRVKSIEEAVDHCNANNLALQGCVFTRDIDRAIAISDAMETGTVQARGTYLSWSLTLYPGYIACALSASLGC